MNKVAYELGQKMARSLVEGLVGAGIGGGAGALFSDENKLRNALIGAGIGGAAGLGVGQSLSKAGKGVTDDIMRVINSEAANRDALARYMSKTQGGSKIMQ